MMETSYNKKVTVTCHVTCRRYAETTVMVHCLQLDISKLPKAITAMLPHLHMTYYTPCDYLVCLNASVAA